jgi:hypothetical protein
MNNSCHSSEREIPAQVFLAMGFLGPEDAIADELSLGRVGLTYKLNMESLPQISKVYFQQVTCVEGSLWSFGLSTKAELLPVSATVF